MIGADALVPPNVAQPMKPNESYTATPVFGSATADTSATVRRGQTASVCHESLVTKPEQSEPPPAPAASLQPRALRARVRLAPPTAVTYWEAAGNSTPYPLSSEPTVTAM